MYAKIFTQIFDSSLADDWQVRIVFEDLLKLCDLNGVVDMTHEALARRTNVPLDVVKKGIAALEQPDARSRTPEHEGRRIIRLDAHRDWGWIIVNYQYYRNLASDEQRREKTAQRVKRFREGSDCNAPVTPCNADVTQCNALYAPVTQSNACNAMQKQKQKEEVEEEVQSPPPQEAGGREVELPPGFPKTAEDAIARAMSVGCPHQFIKLAWDNAAGRGGRDAKGVLIRRWANYVSAVWGWDKQRQAEEKDRNAHKPSSNSGPDRNAGTANEGKASQYDGSKIHRV